MLYNNLHDLINHSKSSRAYFLSLPIDIQMNLNQYSGYITSAQKLHTTAAAIADNKRMDHIGGWDS